MPRGTGKKAQKQLESGLSAVAKRLELPQRTRADQFDAKELFDSRISRESLIEALELDVYSRQAAKEEAEKQGITDAPAIQRFRPDLRSADMALMLRDPENANDSVVDIMRECGIVLPELMAILRQRDIALAITGSSKHVVDVLEDIAVDAKSRYVRCRECRGAGTVEPEEAEYDEPSEDDSIARAELAALGIALPEPSTEPSAPIPCPDCEGTGWLRKIGDAESRKMFLEIHGLRRTGAGGAGNTLNLTMQQGVKVAPDQGATKIETITDRIQKIIDV